MADNEQSELSRSIFKNEWRTLREEFSASRRSLIAKCRQRSSGKENRLRKTFFFFYENISFLSVAKHRSSKEIYQPTKARSDSRAITSC
ncbi:hypothetical protein PUN28_004688 [Cardiocondyla obscurior]|uniref:Uncharacterized protein n=1 Tax=Cardiocondyla obscurior TaxID=286306 RepID=A0AAW2GF63_9HYME